ncbi:MAG TPA: hypothetical protein VFC65_01570 [Prolixibacteraceae bacterium]|nr:hypothetical protein [Prolixibacteraceae bacterium]
MNIETFKIEASHPMDSKSLNISLLNFDFQSLIEDMEHNQTDGELHAMILSKGPERQIVLTEFNEGTIESFQENDSVTIQIIEGKLEFHTENESVILEKSQLLTLHENIKYSLTTSEKTVFLLILTNRKSG